MSGQFNLWRVPVDGGWPDQLTAFTEQTVRQVAVSPRDGTIVVGADRDGDEFHQLYLLDRPRAGPSRSPTSRRCSTSSGPGVLPGRHEARVLGERQNADGRRDLDSRPGLRGHPQRIRGGDVCLCRRLVARGHKAAGHRHPQQQRHVDPPDRPRIGARPERSPLTTRTASMPLAPGRPTDRASTYSPTRVASFGGSRSTTCRRPLRVGRAPDSDIDAVTLSGDGRVLA